MGFQGSARISISLLVSFAGSCFRTNVLAATGRCENFAGPRSPGRGNHIKAPTKACGKLCAACFRQRVADKAVTTRHCFSYHSSSFATCSIYGMFIVVVGQQRRGIAAFAIAASPEERVEEPRGSEDDEEDAVEGAWQLNLSVPLAQPARDTGRRRRIRCHR